VRHGTIRAAVAAFERARSLDPRNTLWQEAQS